MTAPNVRPPLEQAFAFNPAELDLNRRGQLSTAQTKKLDKYRKMRGCGRRAAAIVFGLMAAGIAAAALLLKAPGIDQARPYLLVVAGILAIIFLFSLISDFQAGRDLAQGNLSVAEGNVQTWAKEIKSNDGPVGTAYFMRIGRQKFQLETTQQMQVLQNNHSYRFYYVQNGRVPIILSVEPMETG